MIFLLNLIIYIYIYIYIYTLFAQCFSIKDLGPHTYFLSVEVTSHPHGLLLSQHHYIIDLLACTHMTTPLATTLTLNLHSNTTLLDPSKYWTIVGSLQYLLLDPSKYWTIVGISLCTVPPMIIGMLWSDYCDIFVRPLLIALAFSFIGDLLYHSMLFLVASTEAEINCLFLMLIG